MDSRQEVFPLANQSASRNPAHNDELRFRLQWAIPENTPDVVPELRQQENPRRLQEAIVTNKKQRVFPEESPRDCMDTTGR